MTALPFATLFLLLATVSAFGPFSPVVNRNAAGATSTLQHGLTMRVGTNDMIRRQRFNKILAPSPTKERVETILLSEGTSKLIEKVCDVKQASDRRAHFYDSLTPVCLTLSEYTLVQLEVAQVHASQGSSTGESI